MKATRRRAGGYGDHIRSQRRSHSAGRHSVHQRTIEHVEDDALSAVRPRRELAGAGSRDSARGCSDPHRDSAKRPVGPDSAGTRRTGELLGDGIVDSRQFACRARGEQPSAGFPRERIQGVGRFEGPAVTQDILQQRRIFAERDDIERRFDSPDEIENVLERHVARRVDAVRQEHNDLTPDVGGVLTLLLILAEHDVQRIVEGSIPICMRHGAPRRRAPDPASSAGEAKRTTRCRRQAAGSRTIQEPLRSQPSACSAYRRTWPRAAFCAQTAALSRMLLLVSRRNPTSIGASPDAKCEIACRRRSSKMAKSAAARRHVAAWRGPVGDRHASAARAPRPM